MIYCSLFFLLLLFFQPLWQIFGQPTGLQEQIRLEREARLFFQHLEREVNKSTSYQINGSQLQLNIGGDSITYDQLPEVIRRRLNREGHIVMVQFVDEVEFQSVDKQTFIVRLQLKQDKIEYQIERWLELKINEANQD